jgi:hypothetical protein
MGQPERMERCFNHSTSEEIAADFPVTFQDRFADLMAPDAGGIGVRQAMFPFEDAVRYVVFRIGDPKDVAKLAYRALRAKVRRVDVVHVTTPRSVSAIASLWAAASLPANR